MSSPWRSSTSACAGEASRDLSPTVPLDHARHTNSILTASEVALHVFASKSCPQRLLLGAGTMPALCSSQRRRRRSWCRLSQCAECLPLSQLPRGLLSLLPAALTVQASAHCPGGEHQSAASAKRMQALLPPMMAGWQAVVCAVNIRFFDVACRNSIDYRLGAFPPDTLTDEMEECLSKVRDDSAAEVQA